MRARILAAAATSAIVLALAACGGGGSDSPSSHAPTSADGGATEQDIDASEDDGVGTYGVPYVYPDGVEITLTKPVPESLDGWEDVIDIDVFKAGIAYQMTVKNGTKGPLDLSLFGSNVFSGTADGDLLACEKDIDKPASAIPAGKTATWTQCWAVQDPDDITITAGEDLSDDHPDIVYGELTKTES